MTRRRRTALDDAALLQDVGTALARYAEERGADQADAYARLQRLLGSVVAGDVPRSTTPVSPSDTSTAHRRTPAHGSPWTTAEDDALWAQLRSELPIAEIAREHGRSPGAIHGRATTLGVKRLGELRHPAGPASTDDLRRTLREQRDAVATDPSPASAVDHHLMATRSS